MNKFIAKTINIIPNNLFPSITLNGCRLMSYKSDLSLKNLYPSSNDKLFTPPLPPVSKISLKLQILIFNRRTPLNIVNPPVLNGTPHLTGKCTLTIEEKSDSVTVPV